MPNHEIKPALTLDEWYQVLRPPDTDYLIWRALQRDVSQPYYGDGARTDRPARWMALANAMLSGYDPRALRRDMLDALREQIAAAQLSGSSVWSRIRALEQLADALEALLPPPGPPSVVTELPPPRRPA